MSCIGAINGLLIHSDHMNVLSNNIANASTIGFKSSTPVFYNLMSRSLLFNKNVGSGAGILKNVQDFSDGALIETGRDLDLRIVKDGFFRVLDSQGYIHYTRNGQFLIDKEKNIINMQGMYLTGRNRSYAKNDLNNTFSLKPINLKKAYTLSAKPTSKIQLIAILNSNMDSVTNIDNSNQDILQKPNYNTKISVYHQDETKETISISCNKSDKNRWKVQVESYDSNNKNSNSKIDDNFYLKFDEKGQLISDPVVVIQSPKYKNENIMIDFSKSTEQFDTSESWNECFQDGYPKGYLKTFEILSNGEIVGTYSNKEIQEIGQIVLSKFANPERLQPESGNTWSATQESGKESTGMAGNMGLGTLNTKTLESSNVDLNKELIKMIMVQRNYQSNAQAFKAEDKIINTLINLR